MPASVPTTRKPEAITAPIPLPIVNIGARVPPDVPLDNATIQDTNFVVINVIINPCKMSVIIYLL